MQSVSAVLVLGLLYLTVLWTQNNIVLFCWPRETDCDGHRNILQGCVKLSMLIGFDVLSGDFKWNPVTINHCKIGTFDGLLYHTVLEDINLVNWNKKCPDRSPKNTQCIFSLVLKRKWIIQCMELVSLHLFILLILSELGCKCICWKWPIMTYISRNNCDRRKMNNAMMSEYIKYVLER